DPRGPQASVRVSGGNRAPAAGQRRRSGRPARLGIQARGRGGAPRWSAASGRASQGRLSAAYRGRHDGAGYPARPVLHRARKGRGAAEFSKRELSRGVQSSAFQTAADLDEPLAVLAEHGYVRRAESSSTTKRGGGRPSSPRYAVNPEVLSAPVEGKPMSRRPA